MATVRQTATGPLPGQARYGTGSQMTEKKSQSPAQQAAEKRRQRLAQALRDNLRRRKRPGPPGAPARNTSDEGAADGGAEGPESE